MVKKVAWTLPGTDEARLVLRELTTPQLDGVSRRASSAAGASVFLARSKEVEFGIVDSILEFNGLRVSGERNSEELYHALTARELEMVQQCWTSIHEAPDGLVARVLATHEDLGGGEHRWQGAIDDLRDFDAQIDEIEKREGKLELTEELARLADDKRRVRDHGWIHMCELTGTDVDQVGAQVFESADDFVNAVAAERKELLDRSLVRLHGKKGAGLYAELTPSERSIIREAYERINSVSSAEVAALLGSREAVAS